MNKTHFEHAFYAVLMQAVIGYLSGDWWAGATFGAAFFLGREHAQQEYKLGTVGGSPWPAFDFRRWSLDGIFDLVFPVVAVVAVAFGVSAIG